MLVKDVELLLNELLKHRYQFHLGNDQSCTKLSKIEVDTMCLLLEVIQVSPLYILFANTEQFLKTLKKSCFAPLLKSFS